MEKLNDIGIAVLSHGRRDKLEKSLKSYEENGLTDIVGIILFSLMKLLMMILV